MKKSAVINSEISQVIANMGHFDLLSIGDAGMPVPRDTKKIDLAVTNGVPSFLEVLDNVLEELEVQKIFLAEEIKKANPSVLLSIEERFNNIPIEFIPHSDMKEKLSETHAFIRTGEMTPYANILLESGVTF